MTFSDIFELIFQLGSKKGIIGLCQLLYTLKAPSNHYDRFKLECISHAQTHSHKNSLFPKRSLTRTLSLSLSFSPSHTHTHKSTHSLFLPSHSLSLPHHTHTHTRTYTHAHTHTFSILLSLSIFGTLNNWKR